MKRIRLPLLAFVSVWLMLNACSSGKVAFEHGNYYEAVLTSVNHLRKNADHAKSMETLRQAYPLALSNFEDKAKSTLASNAQFKWTAVVESYTAINVMYDEIRRSPGALKVIPNPANYYAQLENARKNVAEEHYAAGITAMTFNTREKAKEAYGNFTRANEFVPGYKDVIKMMEAALWAATVKVVVEPIPVSKNMTVSAEFFDDKISEYLHKNSINQYVRFFTRKEAQQLKLNPDHIVKLEFDEFTVGQVYLYEKEMKLENDSVVVGSYVAKQNTNTQGQNTNSQNQNTNNQNPNTGNQSQNTNTQNPNPGQNQNQNNRNQGNNQNQGNNNQGQNQNNNNQGQGQNNNNQGQNQNNNNQGQNQNNNNQGQNQNNNNQGQNQNNSNQGQGQNNNNQGQNQNNNNQGQGQNNNNQGQNQNNNNQGQNQNNNNQGNSDNSGNNQGGNTGGNTSAADSIESKERVTICHIPGGNAAAKHTLVISKSALKAHMAHGDSMGSCEDAKDKGKPDNKDGKGTKPKPGDKGKGNGTQAWLGGYEPMYFASANNNFSWVEFPAPVDTTKIYSTVKATLYYSKKTTTSKGIVSFKIIDAKTNALLAVEKMPGEYTWVSEWATFNGDERALTPQQLRLCKKREQVPPPAQDLFTEFTKPIYDQVVNKIKNFYKGY